MTSRNKLHETYREFITSRAGQLISVDRQAAYGLPQESMQRICDLWNAYLSQDRLAADDVAVMLALMKIARMTASFREDNYIDACGYIAIAAECVKEGETE